VLALLKTRRWIGFTSIVILSIIGFGLLSHWQWNRADQQRAARLAISEAQVLQDVDSVNDLAEFTRVRIAGTFDNQDTALVRQRPLDGGNGYWVMTPLDTSLGTRIWVIRGWVGASTVATEVPAVPPAPMGPTLVNGAIRPFEAPLAEVYGLPEGVIAKMSVNELTTPGFTNPIDNRVVQLITSTPPAGEIVTLPLPEVDEVQNVSYAVQWILFALVAIIGWFVFLKREAKTPNE
jgi:cytochrome oxidase assembly protein ShyY1